MNVLKCQVCAGYIIIFLLMFQVDLSAGSLVNTQFPLVNNGTADSGLVNNGGLTLGIKEYVDVKIAGDSIADISNTAIASDLIQKSDTIINFIADSLNNGIYYRKFTIKENGVTPQNSWTRFCDAALPPECFLNADPGNNGYFVSFVRETGGTKKYLRVSTGNASLDIDSTSTTGWLFSSQCTMENDTFLIAYSIDLSSIRLAKIYASGSVITKITDITVAAGSAVPGNSLMTNTVTFDKNSTVFISWNRGSPKGAKYIHFSFFNRDLTGGVSDSLLQKFCDTNFYYTHNAGIASYAPNKIAVFSWDTAGLYLSRINLNGNTIQKTTALIKTGTFRHCAAKSSKNKLFVICKGDVNNNGVSGIEGIRYSIVSDTLGTGKEFCFSDLSKNVNISDAYSTMLNCEIDTAGTMSAVWKHGKTIQGSLVAYRGIRYQSGFWTSVVESLNVNYHDSLYYLPSGINISSEQSWYIEDSIRTGSTSQECRNAQWRSFSDPDELKEGKTTDRYYQYRIKIKRKSVSTADSIITPVISSIRISWNVSPVILSIDSIGIRGLVKRDVAFGNTLSIFSRIDTLHPYLRIRDQDTGDQISYSAVWASAVNVQSFGSSGDGAPVSPLSLLPLPSDTVVVCKFTVRDSSGWSGVEKTLTFAARNSLPQLTADVFLSGGKDSIELIKDTVVLLHESDTIAFRYSVSDTNDPQYIKGFIRRLSGVGSVTIDSTQRSGIYKIICDTIKAVDTVRFSVLAADPDTVSGHNILFVVNNTPKIDSVFCNNQSARNNDTLRIHAGLPLSVNVLTNDANLAFWDTLQLNYRTMSLNETHISTVKNNVMSFTPNPDDSLLDIVITDKYEKKDSIRVFFKFPWLVIDSIKNPLFNIGRDKLKRMISLIDGSDISDTVTLPFLNSGNDPMNITGCKILGTANRWLKLIINNDTITSADKSDSLSVVISPDIPVNLICIMSAKKMTGDSTEIDTILLTTDDPLHDTILIPVYIEYNDLPVIVSVGTDFNTDEPYWRLKKKAASGIQKFPPHASIQISFSEPIDSVSARNAIIVYSVFDSSAAGIILPINVRHTWIENYTKLRISADYKTKSDTYRILPPSGLFIPTDSLALQLTNVIVDQAKTPNGPNSLDIHKIFKRDTLQDTIISMRVDSITFTLISIKPLPADTQIVNNKPLITLSFSAPIYAQSVDTSKIDNKTLIINSLYNNNKQLVFDSVGINANSVVFRIGQKLFYNDMLSCMYRSFSVRDNSGFSIDMSKNGISAADYDSSSSEDNVSWEYRVKNNYVVRVTPVNNAITKEISPEIVLTFSEPVWKSSFDTSLSALNKSVHIRSTYSANNGSFESIRFSDDSMQIYLRTADKYFSSDSIKCNFEGFTKDYLYSKTENLPLTADRTNSSFDWYFFTSNVGFYTFPNPYKPGIDRRHCSAGGPCGIWFKNLHSLKRGINDVSVRVYDMNANIIYDSKKKGVLIHFETGSSNQIPQWLWDTKNMKNELVASGLYIYCIYGNDGKILIKDKLAIVR